MTFLNFDYLMVWLHWTVGLACTWMTNIWHSLLWFWMRSSCWIIIAVHSWVSLDVLPKFWCFHIGLSYACSSDLELAIALQQQEFERQPQRFQAPPPQQQQQQQQSPTQHQPTQSGRPGLVVGPRVRFLCISIEMYTHSAIKTSFHITT